MRLTRAVVPLMLDAASPWTDPPASPSYVRFTVAGNSAAGADVLAWEKVPFSQ
ncbi:hypothetical protein PJ267_16880 [Arthrobacter sp. OVS8]|nr:hypothetical protein PJ267_16880 [Arthrobacter sp. OVS8]